MKTGEGKTLTIVLAAFLNALSNKGVHIVTVNDYLARRDCLEMGKIYKFLGLTINGKKMGVYAFEEHFEKRHWQRSCKQCFPVNLNGKYPTIELVWQLGGAHGLRRSHSEGSVDE